MGFLILPVILHFFLRVKPSSTCFLEAKKVKVDSWINLVEVSFSQSNFSWLMNDSLGISKAKSMLR
jgi:hypothetical protein